MLRRPFHLLLTTLLLLTMIGQILPQAAVLCLGADGHVQLEAAHAVCGEHGDADDANATPAFTGRGDCQDLILASGTTFLRLHSTDDVVCSCFMACPALGGADPLAAPLAAFRPLTIAPNTSERRLSLRSIILLV